MKNRKVIIIGLVILAVLLGAFYLIKPSYSIQTDGVLYVVNKGSKSITIFDLFEGTEVKELQLEIEPHEATVVINPKRIVVTNYGSPESAAKSITVIDAVTNTVEKTIPLGDSERPHGIITMLQENTVGVVTDVGNHLSVVNIATDEVVKQITTQQDFSHLLAHHPFKPLVYVTNINSGTVSVINLDLEKVVKIIPCSAKAEGIDITPDGAEIWVTNIEDNFISVIDTETNKAITCIDTGTQPLRLKFSIDGKQCLVSNAGDGTISIYDTKTKKQIADVGIPGKKNLFEKVIYGTPRPVGILVHPNGRYAFISNYSVGRVEVLDMNSFALVSSIKVGNMPDGLALVY